MKDTITYKILRPIISVLFKLLFTPKIIGKKNIPKNGKIILAGNHTSNLDSILLLSSTKRQIHFLAKIELFQGFKRHLFNRLGLIPVDRKRKNKEAINASLKYLESGLVVGIFPEGTIPKNNELIPYKPGVIKIASESNTPIIPFVISGKYKLFSRSLQIKFLSAFYVTDNFDEDLKMLEEVIRKGD